MDTWYKCGSWSFCKHLQKVQKHQYQLKDGMFLLTESVYDKLPFKPKRPRGTTAPLPLMRWETVLAPVVFVRGRSGRDGEAG